MQSCVHGDISHFLSLLLTQSAGAEEAGGAARKPPPERHTISRDKLQCVIFSVGMIPEVLSVCYAINTCEMGALISPLLPGIFSSFLFP